MDKLARLKPGTSWRLCAQAAACSILTKRTVCALIDSRILGANVSRGGLAACKCSNCVLGVYLPIILNIESVLVVDLHLQFKWRYHPL